MDSMQDRAKNMFPMVLLTLLSIVQALALEFLWDHLRHRSELFEFSMAVIPGWLQIAVTFNVIIIIWLMYAGMLMRFRWTPSTADSIFPFLIGLVEFLMIDIMGSEHFAIWVIILSVTFGALVAIDHRAMRRARADGVNREFFDTIEPATIKDFVPQIVMFIALFVAGVWLELSSYHGWFTTLLLVAIIIGLAYETHKTAFYWRISMSDNQ